jgi:oxygen-dependent protoporphyrinogen oxidase
MNTALVIGAGISGLATAWYLHQHGYSVQVLEAGTEPGGAIRTEAHHNYLLDLGPNSTLDRGEALHTLIGELALGADVVEANRAAQRRYIARGGRLVALPTDPLSFLATPLFSARGKLRLLLEPFHGRAAHEESVAAFVQRRLGREFLDWAIDPFISGVYAGDPARLSARAATAKVYALEAEYRSLSVGALMRLVHGRRAGPAPAGRLIAFRHGMQTLPRTLAHGLADAIVTDATVVGLAPEAGGAWRVYSARGEYSAAQLAICTPAYQAATLLAPLDPALATLLQGVNYAPVATCVLAFACTQIAHPLDGFGMLIPRLLGIRTLGALFSSTLFPGRAPPDHVLITAFIGGARDPAIVDQTPVSLIEHVLADLRPLLGIRGDPVFAHAHLWPRAIPQYELGHLARLAEIDARLGRWPGLHLQANWRGGISVNDCVNSARRLAQRIALA